MPSRPDADTSAARVTDDRAISLILNSKFVVRDWIKAP